jgi:hypothetical protein
MEQLAIPPEDYLNPGHLGCPGCGATIAMKLALKALGEKTIVVIPACCWGILAGPHPHTSLKVPILHTAFATAGAAASGIRAALDMRGDTETTVLSWAGDGGTFDIGFQSLSGAVERNENCHTRAGLEKNPQKKYHRNPCRAPHPLCSHRQHCLSGGPGTQVSKSPRKKRRLQIYSRTGGLPSRLAGSLRAVRESFAACCSSQITKAIAK